MAVPRQGNHVLSAMAILSIQSHVAYGHVGNSAAVFPMQRLGHEVWPIHTVQFSNHTGYGAWTGQVFDGTSISELVDGIAARGVLGQCEAVLSGYLGSAAIGEAVVGAVERVRAANPAAVYCCDPVLGDVGRGLFVRPDVPAFMRDIALPMADIVTPNLFELAFLSGEDCQTLGSLRRGLDAAHAMGPRVILVTSAITDMTPDDALDVFVSTSGGLKRVRTPRLDLAFNGAGDAIAGLFLVHWLRTSDAGEAAALAVSSIYGILQRTKETGARELELIRAQDEIVKPSRMLRAEPV
jgi:pyridoxine kinase